MGDERYCIFHVDEVGYAEKDQAGAVEHAHRPVPTGSALLGSLAQREKSRSPDPSILLPAIDGLDHLTAMVVEFLLLSHGGNPYGHKETIRASYAA